MDSKCESINEYQMKCDLRADHLGCHKHTTTATDATHLKPKEGDVSKWKDLYCVLQGPTPDISDSWFLKKTSAEEFENSLTTPQERWRTKTVPLDPQIWLERLEVITWRRIGEVLLVNQEPQEFQIVNWLKPAVEQMTTRRTDEDYLIKINNQLDHMTSSRTHGIGESR